MKPSHWFPGLAERYRQLGYWTNHSFADCVDSHAAQRPDGRALSDVARSITWAEAKRWTDAVAAGLVRLGLARDSVVATWLPNCIENYLMRTACEKAGLIWLPIPPTARQHELRPLLRGARARMLVLSDSVHRDHWGEAQDILPDLPELPILCLARGSKPRAGAVILEELAAAAPSADEPARVRARSVQPEEVAMLQPTSGSTGVPKLCEYLLAGAMARGRAQAELFHLSERDVMVALVPGFGPSIPPLLAAPVAGAEVVVLDHVDAGELLQLIERRSATIVCGVPPLYREITVALAAGTRSVDSVRIWYSTGMAMPADLARTLEERTKGIVLSGYGGVDFGWWTAPAPEDSAAVRWHTVGQLRGGTEIRLVPDNEREADGEGEAWGRGPSSTGGYFGDPELSAASWTPDGWFRTGDIGRLDGAGNLVILGRKVEVINRGGQKIHPAELEQLIVSHPRVARAAVVPFPDDRLGERVCACVVPHAGLEITLDDIVAFLRERRVASYKLPERLKALPVFPTTSGGKVDRAALRAQVATGDT